MPVTLTLSRYLIFSNSSQRSSSQCPELSGLLSRFSPFDIPQLAWWQCPWPDLVRGVVNRREEQPERQVEDETVLPADPFHLLMGQEGVQARREGDGVRRDDGTRTEM